MCQSLCTESPRVWKQYKCAVVKNRQAFSPRGEKFGFLAARDRCGFRLINPRPRTRRLWSSIARWWTVCRLRQEAAFHCAQPALNLSCITALYCCDRKNVSSSDTSSMASTETGVTLRLTEQPTTPTFHQADITFAWRLMK